MSTQDTPALVDFRPPQGMCFAGEGDCPLAAIARDLCKIAAFLQGFAPYSTLVRYEDWWDHDGLYFERCRIDFHGLFQLVETPRALLAATPGDEYVCVGIMPEDRAWYLRFRADWDDPGENLLGFYSLTLDDGLVKKFESEVILNLKCQVRRVAPSEP